MRLTKMRTLTLCSIKKLNKSQSNLGFFVTNLVYSINKSYDTPILNRNKSAGKKSRSIGCFRNRNEAKNNVTVRSLNNFLLTFLIGCACH